MNDSHAVSAHTDTARHQPMSPLPCRRPMPSFLPQGTRGATQSTSALGTTTTINSGQVAKYAIGGGMSEGAASLHDFYLSLAKQATPVIEVGAAKEITVIVSEGKELEIREFEGDTL
jgi:hypothetical protein